MASPRFVTGLLQRHIAVMTSAAALGLLSILALDRPWVDYCLAY